MCSIAALATKYACFASGVRIGVSFSSISGGSGRKAGRATPETLDEKVCFQNASSKLIDGTAEKVNYHLVVVTINGLYRGKSELEVFLEERGVLVMLVTETHMKQGRGIGIRGFHVLRKDRQSQDEGLKSVEVGLSSSRCTFPRNRRFQGQI